VRVTKWTLPAQSLPLPPSVRSDAFCLILGPSFPQASALVLLCCTVTDLCELLGVAPCTSGVYCCGNFGLLVVGAVEGACAASLDCLRVLRDMAAISTQVPPPPTAGRCLRPTTAAGHSALSSGAQVRPVVSPSCCAPGSVPSLVSWWCSVAGSLAAW
jgi:hypothetical protein